MTEILHFFTQAVASGISLTRIAVHSILPNLYVINQRDDDDVDLVYSGDYPNYYPQAYGEYLDRLGYMFNVARFSGETDDAYRQRILFSISKNATPSGIRDAIKFLLQTKQVSTDVVISSNFNTFFDAETSSLDYPMRDPRGSMLFSINIFVRPRKVRQGFYFKAPSDIVSSDEVLEDDSGNPLTSQFGDYIKVKIKNGETFDKYEPVYYNYFEDVFNADSFQVLLDDIAAAGITVESVTFLEPGAAGAKGESYAY